MTKEYIFTLEANGRDLIWKCVVSDDKCVTYEGDVECETFQLTTQEKRPHVLQLDTVAKVYEENLPLQIENGMPFIKIAGSWECSDTTDEDRLQAKILKYKKEAFYYAMLGVAFILFFFIDRMFLNWLGDMPMALVLGIFCITCGGITMVRLKNELAELGRKLDWKLTIDDFKKK